MQPLLCLVGARTSEGKVNINVEKEWYWLTGDWESADLGIRTAATPGDLVAGSDNQEGMESMRRPESEWPCKKSFGHALTEDIVALACPTIVVEKKGHQKEDDQARTKKGYT